LLANKLAEVAPVIDR